MNVFRSLLEHRPASRSSRRHLAKLLEATDPDHLVDSFCALAVLEQLQLLSMLRHGEPASAFVRELTKDTLPLHSLDAETRAQLAMLARQLARPRAREQPWTNHDIEELIADAQRPCSVALTWPLATPHPPLRTSRLLGGRALMLPHEQWPMSGDEPMTCILHIRVDELPYIPDLLQESSWIVLYADVTGPYVDASGWVIREYPSSEGLAEREAPALQAKAARWTPLHVEWALFHDIPDGSSDLSVLGDLEAQWRENLDKIRYYPIRRDRSKYGREAHLLPWERHAKRTKVGGFPTLGNSQDEDSPSHPRRFLLQIFHDNARGVRPSEDGSEVQGRPYDLCDGAVTYVGLDEDCSWIVWTDTH